MDDNQLERELAAPQGAPAGQEKPSEADPTTAIEAVEEPVETGTEGTDVTDASEPDAGTDAGDDAGDDGSGSEEDDKSRKRKPSGSERWKRRAEAAERELIELRRPSTGDGEPTQDALEAEIGKPPKEEDFKGDFLAYERALTAYELDKRQTIRALKGRATAAQVAAAEVRREAAEAHNERMEEFAAKVPDFTKTLEAAKNLQASPIVEDLILDSDKSAHIVYHLAKNPDRLAKLNAMSEREAAREIGRIEARLSLPTPKTTTKASAPLRKVSGGAAPAFNPETADMEAFAEHYNKTMEAREKTR